MATTFSVTIDDDGQAQLITEGILKKKPISGNETPTDAEIKEHVESLIVGFLIRDAIGGRFLLACEANPPEEVGIHDFLPDP